MTETTPVPLARLLTMASRHLIDALHERLRRAGWTDVRPSYGFVLLAVRDAAVTTTELATLLGVSKQAASKLVDAMIDGGFVQRVTDDDRRLRRITLAPRGHDLLRAVEAIYGELEASWAESIGTDGVDAVRDHLTRVLLRAHGGALPAVRPVT